MKKKKALIFVAAVVVLLLLVTIPGWINDIPTDKNNTESQSANNDGNNDKNDNAESKQKLFITDEDDFTLWNPLMIYYQKEKKIFRSLQLAECQWEGQRYYGLYNDEVNLVFRDDEKAIEIAQKGQQESHTLYPKYYDFYDFEDKGTYIHRFDINLDGTTEVLIFAGAIEERIGHVDIIDIVNQTMIPINSTAEDLANNMPQIEVLEEKYSEDGKRESIVVKDSINGAENSYTLDLFQIDVDTIEFVVDTQNYDFVRCTYESEMFVESVIGIKTGENEVVNVGRITGKLVYQPETKVLELDKENISVDWYTSREILDVLYGDMLNSQWNPNTVY